MTKRYVVSMNLSGLYSDKPIECTKDEQGWWDKAGDIEASKLGLDDNGVLIQFVTTNKHDAEMYLMGVKTALRQIKRYCEGWVEKEG